MFIVAHTLAGGAVGGLMATPVGALGFGVLTHHLLDAIPHYDLGSWRKMKFSKKEVCQTPWTPFEWTGVILDFLISIILIAILYQASGNPLIIWGGIGGILPDVWDNSPLWRTKLRKFLPFRLYHQFHEGFHLSLEKKSLIWVGILTQIIVLGGSLWILLRFS